VGGPFSALSRAFFSGFFCFISPGFYLLNFSLLEIFRGFMIINLIIQSIVLLMGNPE